jgi:peptidoglycan/LPS O-acetylase OafA/YrhL
VAELSFTQNYWRAIWGQTWSLAVEEHFYLLLPLLLWLVRFQKLGFGLLLCKVIDARPHRVLAPVAKLGYYSYSIYLWHSWACRLLP